MKRYQLIGRKTALKRKTKEYPKNHLHSLPYEILLKVFSHFENDARQLTKLALVCTKFSHIINKNFLYKSVRFVTPEQFLKFSSVHITSKRFGAIDTTPQINLIQVIRIPNPPCKPSNNFETKIAGSYSVEAGQLDKQLQKFNNFVKNFKTLLDNDYSLKTVEFSQISHRFQLDSYKSQISNKSRTLDKLVLKAETGWSILFRANSLNTIMETFGIINNLELHNFIIDESKLISEKLTRYPLIHSLTLIECSYSSRPSKRELCGLFAKTTHLSVLSMLKSMDLSFIDMIKYNNRLEYLCLDLSSSFFYTKDTNDFNYRAFNPFFKLVCSRLGNYGSLNTLVLENFDLIHELNHDKSTLNRALASIDEMAEAATERIQGLKDLFVLLSSMPFVVFKQPTKVCKKCGFTKIDRACKWSTLKYLNTKFKVCDHHTVIQQSDLNR